MFDRDGAEFLVPAPEEDAKGPGQAAALPRVFGRSVRGVQVLFPIPD